AGAGARTAGVLALTIGLLTCVTAGGDRTTRRKFPLARVIYTWYTYSVCSPREATHECPPRAPCPAARGAEVRLAAAERGRGADGRGLAAQRRAGVHDAAAAGA